MSGEHRGQSYLQLDMTGGEATMTAVRRANHPLTTAQREILRELRLRGTLRSLDAGVILHAHRPTGPCRPPVDGRSPCCEHASSDGSDALKRLAARGLCKSAGAGLWIEVRRG